MYVIYCVPRLFSKKVHIRLRMSFFLHGRDELDGEAMHLIHESQTLDNDAIAGEKYST